jgi:hypothetical protein
MNYLFIDHLDELLYSDEFLFPYVMVDNSYLSIEDLSNFLSLEDLLSTYAYCCDQIEFYTEDSIPYENIFLELEPFEKLIPYQTV